ncbi:hypothetical protein BDD12DRAFT_767925 [Trichophaea hybrida]|nr:hypothetical protein BDD12DRAFT_767925 [Trichophaea hybrida]
MKPGDEWNTVISMKYRQYENLVMAVRFVNMPATFLDIMNEMLRDLSDHRVSGVFPLQNVGCTSVRSPRLASSMKYFQQVNICPRECVLMSEWEAKNSWVKFLRISQAAYHELSILEHDLYADSIHT